MAWQPLPDRRDGELDAPVPVTRLLDQVMAGLGAPSVEAIVVIHERWVDVVGEELAGHAEPVAVEDGRLRITVDSPAWTSHLRWAEREVLGRLEQLLGSGVVTAITARTAAPRRRSRGPSAPR